MGSEFQKYALEDFLDDQDFCGWARSERPDLDVYYQRMLETYPEQKKIFRKAYRLVRLFDDEKVETTLARKLELWEEAGKSYRRQRAPLKPYRQIFRYAAAAALFIAVGAGIYYYVTTGEKEYMATYDQQDFAETKLSLDDGREIRIESGQSIIVYDRSGRQLRIDDKLIEKGERVRNGEAMNQLSVSFGKTSKIILSDHTEVWLNAGSRLVYPSVFEGGKRRVRLQGEALFRVSHDKTKPFIVETNHSKVRVLGTTFNIKAYPDEKFEETVLLEGSVSLSLNNTFLAGDLVIKPNQRVVVSKADNSYVVSKVDVGDYTSWTDGLFVFTDEPMPSVLMHISRYYNLKIKWTKEVESRKISGKLDLKNGYQRVLLNLATISDGNYKEKEGVIFFKLNNNQNKVN